MRLTGLGLTLTFALAMTATWAQQMTTPQVTETKAQRAKSIVAQKRYGVSSVAMQRLQTKYDFWRKARQRTPERTVPQRFEQKRLQTHGAANKKHHPGQWGHQCPYQQRESTPSLRDAKAPIVEKSLTR